MDRAKVAPETNSRLLLKSCVSLSFTYYFKKSAVCSVCREVHVLLMEGSFRPDSLWVRNRLRESVYTESNLSTTGCRSVRSFCV
jgi:hypothetical protein